jgi:hypothetical protein
MVIAGNDSRSNDSSIGIPLPGRTNGVCIEPNTKATTAFDSDDTCGAVCGIKARAGGSMDGSAVFFTGKRLRNNRISQAGSAGILIQFACQNSIVNDDLSGDAGNVGIIFDGTSGANAYRADDDRAFQVIDNGAYCANRDGINDPNPIQGTRGTSKSVAMASTSAHVATVFLALRPPMLGHGVLFQ